MEKRWQQLQEAGAAIAQAEGRETVLALVVQAAKVITGATYTSVGLVEGTAIHWQTAAGKPPAEVKGVRQPVGEGLCGWVVRHGRPRRSDDVTEEPDYFCQYAEMCSELDVPIPAGEQVLGVLSAESPEPGAFTEEDEALLQILATYAAIALVHGKL